MWERLLSCSGLVMTGCGNGNDDDDSSDGGDNGNDGGIDDGAIYV